MKWMSTCRPSPRFALKHPASDRSSRNPPRYTMTIEPRIEWKRGVFAALAITLIALYPQLNLWITRGKQWHGSYVMTQGDEVMYSAYANALIDGRPRKNDP